MIEEKIAILDLGSYKIKILVISLNKNNYIDIHSKYSTFSSGIKKGNVVDIEKLSEQIKFCLSSIEKEINQKISEIYVGINSIDFNFLTFGLSRNIGSYEIEEKKDLQNLINLAFGIFKDNLKTNKVIHFLNSGFYLDKKNYVENPLGLRSKTLDINFSFLSLDKNIILNYNKAITKAGLNIKKYFYSPFATSILSSDQDTIEKGFTNIDFGFDKTCITFFENSKLLYSNIIPIGSNHINNDLIRAAGVNKDLAEKIKLNYDKILENNFDKSILIGKDDRKISSEIITKIIDARLEEIVEYIYKNILYCRSLNRSARKIIVTGGGAELKILSSKLSKKLNTDVEHAKQTFPIKNTEFNIFSDYMVCLGIAKLIFFPFKDEIKGFSSQNKNFFEKFYSMFLK
ncbi:cell division FtsA domain-containing protein [Candidatus Pelagibacter sp. HIMB1517]|uniref:cell division FtsA domain-containing protein n=1 Tax=Candidatus Pelagibacter sp. HIMB1517 TaxID=3413341 RepID=UPI003F86A215